MSWPLKVLGSTPATTARVIARHALDGTRAHVSEAKVTSPMEDNNFEDWPSNTHRDTFFKEEGFSNSSQNQKK